MTAIEKCHTAALCCYIDTCENCGNTEISYNSCRNRHCPKWQTLSKERWIETRKQDLLNTGYFKPLPVLWNISAGISIE